MDPSLEFTYWAEDRLLFVLAFSLERDDHEHARYLWEWGDGTTTHGDALASHDYRTDGDRFLVKVTRLVDGVATHTSEAWVLLDDWLWATDDDPLQPRGAQTTNGATTPPGRQDAPHAAPAERIVLEAREQRIVYEAPAVVLPGILLVLTAITLGRRRFPR